MNGQSRQIRRGARRIVAQVRASDATITRTRMTPKRAAAWLGGSMLLAAWLAAAAAPSLEPVSEVEPDNPRVSEPDRQVLMLAAEAERLRQRLNIVAVRRPVTRNLF